MTIISLAKVYPEPALSTRFSKCLIETLYELLALLEQGNKPSNKRREQGGYDGA